MGVTTWSFTLRAELRLRLFKRAKVGRGISEGAICPVLFAKCDSGYQIKNNKLGGVCDTYGKKGEGYIWFWCGNLRARDHLEDIGVDGRVNMLELSDRDIDWIDMAQHM